MKRERLTEEDEEINKPKSTKKIHYPKVVITNVYTNSKSRRRELFDTEATRLVVDAYDAIVDSATFDKFVEVYEEAALDSLRSVCEQHGESNESKDKVYNIKLPIGLFNAAVTKGYDLYCKHIVDYETFKNWRMWGLTCKSSLFAECHSYMQTMYYEVLEDPSSETYNDDIDVKLLELIKNYCHVLHLFTPHRVQRFNGGLSLGVDKHKLSKVLDALVEEDKYDRSHVFDFRVVGEVSKYFWTK